MLDLPKVQIGTRGLAGGVGGQAADETKLAGKTGKVVTIKAGTSIGSKRGEYG